MCKYCEGLKINPMTLNGEQEPLYEDQDMIIQVAQDTPIGRRVGYSSLDILLGHEVKEVKIFYCPMCGRELNYNGVKKEKIVEEKRAMTKDDWKKMFGGQMLLVIKHFVDRLKALPEIDSDDIKVKMGNSDSGFLKFVKDTYDSGRLNELDTLLREKEL